jgi:hypothetical protein
MLALNTYYIYTSIYTYFFHTSCACSCILLHVCMLIISRPQLHNKFDRDFVNILKMNMKLGIM